MADLAEAFEQHLRSLSDSDWDALVARVRTPMAPPQPDEHGEPSGGQNAGLEEARRRGYVDEKGNPIQREAMGDD
jgi:hypothetical protein